MRLWPLSRSLFPKQFLPLAGASVTISVVGITVAVLAYALRRLDLGAAVAGRFPAVNAFLANKWYLDDINDKLFVQGSRRLARSVLEVDSKVVDGVVKSLNVEAPGKFEVSDADSMLRRVRASTFVPWAVPT